MSNNWLQNHFRESDRHNHPKLNFVVVKFSVVKLKDTASHLVSYNKPAFTEFNLNVGIKSLFISICTLLL